VHYIYNIAEKELFVAGVGEGGEEEEEEEEEGGGGEEVEEVCLSGKRHVPARFGFAVVRGGR
jgi:hypothetical protein